MSDSACICKHYRTHLQSKASRRVFPASHRRKKLMITVTDITDKISLPKFELPKQFDLDSSSEVRPAQVRHLEVRAPEIRPAEVRRLEVRAPEIRPAEVRHLEVRAPEIRPAEVRHLEVRAPEGRSFSRRVPRHRLRSRRCVRQRGRGRPYRQGSRRASTLRHRANHRPVP